MHWVVVLSGIPLALSDSIINTFTDSNCQISLSRLDGPDGWNGTCTPLHLNDSEVSFRIDQLDPGCVVTIYGANIDARPCSGIPVIASENTCYDASYQYYSVDECSAFAPPPISPTQPTTSPSSITQPSTSSLTSVIQSITIIQTPPIASTSTTTPSPTPILTQTTTPTSQLDQSSISTSPSSSSSQIPAFVHSFTTLAQNTTASPTKSTSSTPATNSSPSDQSQAGAETGNAARIAAPIAIGVPLLALFVYLLWRSFRNKTMKMSTSNGDNNSVTSDGARRVGFRMSIRNSIRRKSTNIKGIELAHLN